MIIFFDNTIGEKKIINFNKEKPQFRCQNWVSLLPPLARCHQIRSISVTRPPPWPRRPPRRSAARGWWQQRNINININSCIQFIETLNCNPSGWLTAASVVTYLGSASAAAAGCLHLLGAAVSHVIALQDQSSSLNCTAQTTVTDIYNTLDNGKV